MKLILLSLLALTLPSTAKPLKVFILAGQSNMEGHAKIETFDYIGDDPATAPLLKMMRGSDGKPTICDHVWISYLTGIRDNEWRGLWQAHGGLWFAARSGSKSNGKIGPEFTFGLTMDAALERARFDHQDRVGREEPAHGVSSAERGPV
jgi:hypothetical protein